MPRGKSISPAQEKIILELYQQGVSVKEILKQAGINSSQTMYSVLDEHRVPRKPKLKGVPKSFYIEEDVVEILKLQPNTSRYVNNAIRYYFKSDKK